jgi:starch synthase (maltosyl-transferring)
MSPPRSSRRASSSPAKTSRADAPPKGGRRRAKPSDAASQTAPDDGRRRVLIEGVYPEIDAGASPIKRVSGDRVDVELDLVSDGHDRLAGVVLYKPVSEATWRERPLAPLVNDRWAGSFEVEDIGRWHYTFEAWVDAFATWRHGLSRKLEASDVAEVDLLVGAELVAAAAERASGPSADRDREALESAAARLRDGGIAIAERAWAGLSEELSERMRRHPDRRLATRYHRELEVVVDRPLARFSSWYELFPRSWGPPGQHGTFRDVEARLPYVADMGFDILYFPPIHPIGVTFRKGPNNSLQCSPGDPGSPWAIGGAEGGHKAIHPELGTLDDFRSLVRRAGELGLEVALDIAFQVSPDHPYVKDHPDWFVRRPDGTIQYAENPPKKYQDVYPFDFECEDWRGLWDELLSVFLYWIEQGVKVFRVDNPHTKALRFWGWCIGEITAKHPEVIFLSEAFTRPKLMYALAKLGFTQSYTYFTWRNSGWELRQYMEELTSAPAVDIFRPNFWPNTPDILPEHLQHGGRPMFITRVVLASTLASSYGVYGPAFELCEHVPRPGSGEYLDNEKYELKVWDLDRPDSLRPVLTRLNQIRRDNPALHDIRSLRFHPTDNEMLLCYSKRTDDGDNVILVVVNLDPHHTQAGWTALDLEPLGVDPAQPFEIHDLLGDARYLWQGAHNYIELNPHALPAHVFRVLPNVRREQDFDNFE